MMWGSQMPPDLLPKMGAAVCGLIFAVFVLQILLFPLRTNTKKESFLWEALMAGVCLFLLGGGLMEAVGFVAMLAVLFGFMGFAAGVVFIPLMLLVYVLVNLSNKTATTNRFQFSLGELLTMVLTSAALPWSVSLSGVTVARAFTVLLFVMPLLYWRAYARLRNNCVPLCTERILFLACYPTMVLGTFYCSVTIFADFAAVQFESLPTNGVAQAVFASFIIAGTVLAHMLGALGKFERTTLPNNGASV